MEASYNSRCPAVKRLFREAVELQEATEEYYAQPLEDNLFEWHFTVRGPPDTPFDGGIYHGRIIMPADYPMKPPNIIFLTPNGRFETNKKICLSISGHHPETWQPSWSIRTALLAIIGFMPTAANGTIGSLDYPPTERQKLAAKSTSFECQECGCIGSLLKDRTGNNESILQEARELTEKCSVTVKQESVDDSPGNSTEETVMTNSSDSQSEENNTENEAAEPIHEVLMEGARAPSVSATVQADTAVSASGSSGLLYNLVLSSAVVAFVALVIRRIFLLENGDNEELDDLII